MKTLFHIRITAIFFLILIPLIYLYGYFRELEQKYETVSFELIKEQLLGEMNNFQEDLKPKTHIETAFKDLEKNFKFPNFSDTQYTYSYDENNKPNFIGKGFINYAKAFLKEKYGFEPMIFVCSGYDLTNIDIDDNNSILKGKDDKNRFLYSCIGSILFRFLENSALNFNGYKPLLPSSENIFKRENINIINYNKIYKDKLKKEIVDFKNSFTLEIIKKISIFYKEIGKSNNCISFFSNNFGNNDIYQYYNVFINTDKNRNNILGLYYVLVKSSDILINKILYTACKNSNLSKIKRNISKKEVSKPTWDYSENKIRFYSPFPFYFYNFVQEHKESDKKSCENYLLYLKNHSLELSIDKSETNNYYTKYKEYTIIAICIIILGLTIYIFNIFLNFIKVNLSLTFKVKIIVLVAVIIPMTGLFIILNLTLKNEEKIIITNIENKINERMTLLEKIKDDVVDNLTFDMLKHKKIISDAYFKYKPDYFIKRFSKNGAKIQKDSEALNLLIRIFKSDINSIYNNIAYAIILDRNGKNICFSSENSYGETVHFKKLINLYRIMSDMHLLDNNTSENQNNSNQNLKYSSITEVYFENHNSHNILAKEGYLIQSESLTLKDKIVYQLLTPEKNPNLPRALVYSFLNMRDIMAYRFNTLLLENYNNLLEQNLENAQVKYALFERNASEFREKIHQPDVYPFKNLQLEAVRKAIGKERSGSEIKEDDNYYYLINWRYYRDNPSIIVSAALITKTKMIFINGKIITLFLLFYSIIAVVFLSDFFSGALLEPINSFSKFLNYISIGHLNVKINMNSGDEMEELSDSFNKMSVGLCEREKLKRFVSDKLFTSLENPTDKKITRAKVTVLSSDIRSFTTISEKNSPEAVVSLLNDYFTLMEKSIIKYGGSIEKIVGDAISAAFYEEKNKDYVLNACKAALEMREQLSNFNKERISKGLFSIENGIGLATGEVMIGFAGKKARRREFLLIGDILKTAENLESMTKKAISSKVFIDEPTYECVKNKIELCSENKESEIFYRELKL